MLVKSKHCLSRVLLSLLDCACDYNHNLYHSLTRSLIHTATRPPAHPPTHSLTHSITRLPACSPAHLLAHSLTHSFRVANLQVSSNQRGVNASQVKLGGTGLGSFNDRFRDALVGGSPFASPLFQGWVTGTTLQGVSALTPCQYIPHMLCTVTFDVNQDFSLKC